MKGIRGRRAFVGSLTSADEITATRGFLTKQQKKDARKRDTGDLSAAERTAIEAEAKQMPLAVQKEEAALLAITPSQRVFSVLQEEKVTGQVNGEAVFWSKLKGGVGGFLAETQVMLPFVHFALKLLAVRGLKDEKVKELETRGPARVLLNGAWVSSTSPSSWRAKFLSASPASWLAKVHLKAQAQHGLLNKMASLRRARLARENPWKSGTGAVEGEVAVKGGAVQRGFACPYCVREGRRLQHWRCVACFLSGADRRALGVFVFANTCVPYLLRVKSEAANAAVMREGRAW